jgi:hypothetical protein
LPRIVQLLNDDTLAPIVVTVLFNICVDYGRMYLGLVAMWWSLTSTQSLLKRLSTKPA